MFIITGATSNTGSVVAHRLLDAGKKVRVIGRSEDKLKQFTIRGAESAVSEPNDPIMLKKAFTGGTAAWIMIQPNYINDSPDFLAYQQSVIDAVSSAIIANPLDLVVNLSSWGADKTSGSGPVVGLHHMEKALERLPILRTINIRAGYFMENLLSYIPDILEKGRVDGPVDQDLVLPLVTTGDIGNVAADSLIDNGIAKTHIRELHGERDMTIREIIRIIGKRIDDPQLSYNQISLQEFKASLIAGGFSQNVSSLMEEVVQAMNAGLISTLQERSVHSTTSTSFESFLENVFLPEYLKSKGL
jgi:uncharacterized protein YbjT (DUF2867 family)